MNPRTLFSGVSVALTAIMLVGCQSLMGPPYSPSPTPSQPSGSPQPGAPGTPQPQPGTPEPQPQPTPTPAPTQPQRQFRLGSASTALVKQAQTQTGKGDFGAATATLERALRIEPDNPLLWIELGKVHMAEGNAAQAESMGRKAVALSVGDPSAQSASWRLVGDALRARGRTLDATEAYQKANAAVPR